MEVQLMQEYEKPYFILVRASEEALRAIEKSNFGLARDILITAQQQAEDAILSYADSIEST